MDFARRLLLSTLLFALLTLSSFSATEAWYCNQYNFSVTAEGIVQVENESNRSEPAQYVDIFVNGDYIDTFFVPAMPRNTTWTEIGSIATGLGLWNWEAIGSLDCQDSGQHQGPRATFTGSSTPTASQEVSPTQTPGPTASETPPPPTPHATEREGDCDDDDDCCDDEGDGGDDDDDGPCTTDTPKPTNTNPPQTPSPTATDQEDDCDDDDCCDDKDDDREDDDEDDDGERCPTKTPSPSNTPRATLSPTPLPTQIGRASCRERV